MVRSPKPPRHWIRCGQGLAVQRDFGGHRRKIALLLEAEDFTDVDVAVGELVGDAQIVGVQGLLVPGPVTLAAGLSFGK